MNKLIPTILFVGAIGTTAVGTAIMNSQPETIDKPETIEKVEVEIEPVKEIEIKEEAEITEEIEVTNEPEIEIEPQPEPEPEPTCWALENFGTTEPIEILRQVNYSQYSRITEVGIYDLNEAMAENRPGGKLGHYSAYIQNGLLIKILSWVDDCK